MTTAPRVHLIGSVPLTSVEEVMTTCASVLGPLAHRIPDGEASGWVNRPAAALAYVEGLKRPDDGASLFGMPVWKLMPGVDPDSLLWVSSDYPAAAKSSYQVFRRLRDEGKIRKAARFQVSMPTPYATLGLFLQASDLARTLPSYARHVHRELEEILGAVPPQDLSIQWDTAVEVIQILEKTSPAHVAIFTPDDIAGWLATACNWVPPGVELGVHLCYGNPGGKHLVEPKDTSVLVNFCARLLPRIKRELNWLHMPVPIERDDDAYFTSLAKLQLSPATEFYLGLVHPRDGLEGGRRRINTAARFSPPFGVATECGLRFFPADSIDALLALHRSLAEEAARRFN
jgi:hypothetical protein